MARRWRSYVIDAEARVVLGEVLRPDPDDAERRASYLASVASRGRGSRCYATQATTSSTKRPLTLPRILRGAWGPR